MNSNQCAASSPLAFAIKFQVIHEFWNGNPPGFLHHHRGSVGRHRSLHQILAVGRDSCVQNFQFFNFPGVANVERPYLHHSCAHTGDDKNASWNALARFELTNARSCVISTIQRDSFK